MTDIEFIKKFNNINTSSICKKYGLYRNNVYTGKTSKEKIKMVKDEILRQLTLLLVESDTNGKENTL